MKRSKKGEDLMVGFVVLSVYIFILFACAPTKIEMYPKKTPPEKPAPTKPSLEKTSPEKTPALKPFPGKTYAEAISEWKSYQDVAKWMENDFSLDGDRYKRYEGTLPIPRASEETFRLKSGIYVDAAYFLKETLNRINPSYNARIAVLIMRPYGFNHYVCSFKAGVKLFLMDYGTPYREITGIHGPYDSLEEYKKFYETHHPIKRKIEAITFLK
jgi:hypothetical protein